MRSIAIALLLTGCWQPVSRGGGPRDGIVSTNPCADAMLVRLVAPQRVTAISRYSQDAGASSMPLGLAHRFRTTAGTAEEVIALRPALVLASSFTAPSTRDAYARAGLRVVYLDSPTTIAASIAQVRQVAEAVGETGRGDAMIAQITGALPRRSPGRDKREPAALVYIAGDLANGAGTLLDELTRRAGFRNAAADYGLANTGTLPTELLVAHPPAVIIASGEGRTAELRRRLLPRTPQASFDRRLVNCGGPAIPTALARLRAIGASL